MIIFRRFYVKKGLSSRFLENTEVPNITSVTFRSKRGLSSEIFLPKKPVGPNLKTFRRVIRLFALGLFCSGAGFIMAAMPAFKVADEFLNPPSDQETLSKFTPDDDKSKEIESYLNSHPFVLKMRSQPEFKESRPHLKIPEPQRPNNLLAGTLMGPEMLVVPPITWVDEQGKSLVTVVYLGNRLCGHPNLIHGGLLATLLDESLARCCFLALPNKVAMTANLNVNYQNPTPADSYVVIRAKVTDTVGRKAWATGQIEALMDEGKSQKVLVDATGLFIEPKQAATMARIYPIS